MAVRLLQPGELRAEGTAAARAHEALAAAILAALAAITPADARGYFDRAGYPAQGQLT